MERLKLQTKIYDENSNDMNLGACDKLTPVQEFIQDQNHCCLCGSELSFEHKIDHLTLTIVENAKCEACHISLRTRSFSVQ